MSNTEHLRNNFHMPHLTSTRSPKLATSFQGGDGTADSLFYAKSLKPFARQLRSNMTEAESLLWHRIRKKQLLGIKTLRFTNTEILKHCTEVLYRIEQSIVLFTSFEGGREHFLRAGGC
jgi:hypothetical protein